MNTRDPVGCGLLVLSAVAAVAALVTTGVVEELPERLEHLAEMSGPFGLAMAVWAVTLLSVTVAATTALLGWFPAGLPGTARAAVVSGAVALLLGLGWIAIGGPDLGRRPPRRWGPEGTSVESLNALAAAALVALESLVAAVWFLLLDAIRRARRGVDNDPAGE